MSNTYISPFARPVYVMVKPVGSICNLACDYCYYQEKGKFYPEAKNQILSEELLARFIAQYMACQTMGKVLFTWHGGEPLMRDRPLHRWPASHPRSLPTKQTGASLLLQSAEGD